MTDYILAEARARGVVRVYPIGAVTRGLGRSGDGGAGGAGRGRLRRLLRRRAAGDELGAPPPGARVRAGVRPADRLARRGPHPRRGRRHARGLRVDGPRAPGHPGGGRGGHGRARHRPRRADRDADPHRARVDGGGRAAPPGRQGARRAGHRRGDAPPSAPHGRGAAHLRRERQDGAAAPVEARRGGVPRGARGRDARRDRDRSRAPRARGQGGGARSRGQRDRRARDGGRPLPHAPRAGARARPADPDRAAHRGAGARPRPAGREPRPGDARAT